MNRHVNVIAGRLSLRAPQRRSLEILDRITEIAPPRKGANQPDSAIYLKAVILDDDDIGQKTATLVSQSRFVSMLGLKPADATASAQLAGQDVPSAFSKPEEQKVAQIAFDMIRNLALCADTAQCHCGEYDAGWAGGTVW